MKHHQQSPLLLRPPPQDTSLLHDIESSSSNSHFTATDHHPPHAILDSWTHKEKENLQVQQLRDELYPQRTPMHHCFLLFSIVTGLTGVLMGLGQLIGFFYYNTQEGGMVQSVIRVYMIGMCGLVVINELEWISLTRDSKILWIWISRGIVYSFIGVIGIQDVQVSDAQQALSTDIWSSGFRRYLKIMAWSMVMCGAVYFVLGCCCMQIVLSRLRKGYAKRIASARESRRSRGLSSWSNRIC